MRYFPVFMDIQDQPVLVIGAGCVAERKARLLLRAGARVEILARELNPQFKVWVEQGQVAHLAPEYHADHLRSARLVFAATNDALLNAQVFEDAEALRIPVNVVDDPRHCRFISPAVVDRSPVQVAISTGGSSPVLARRIRAWIEALLPLGLGRVAEAGAALRQRVRNTLPVSRRREFWDGLLNDRQLRSWSLQSQTEIEQQMTKRLAASQVGKDQASHAQGRVYVVGAGPGRADLLTLRALHVMGQADVILHDRLASAEVMDLARRDARRIYVGKQAGHHHCTQQTIHRIMKEEADKGHIVVRLKGGDPFIFGRGGEEIEFLRQHGICYEVVPGITAAAGCAAYAGIPLTHRDHAHALTFVSGHQCSESGSALDWSALAGAGRTVALYMGLRQAANVRRDLLKAGIRGGLPVALVLNGTMDDQRVIHGTVDSLPQLAAQANQAVPGLLIIGHVASMGSNLGWFSTINSFKSAA